jgi:hypothetical protein
VKAIHVDGYGDKWLISLLPDNPWSPRITVHRIGGIAQTYDTEAQANAVIATLTPPDRQGVPRAVLPPLDPDEKPKRVKRD